MFEVSNIFDVLGAYVCLVLVGVDVLDSKFLILPCVSNKVVARIDVLSPLT